MANLNVNCKKGPTITTQEIISVIKAKNKERLPEYIQQGLKLLGNLNFRPDDSVVIKPNLCAIKGPETGATTDPLVVEELIRYLQKEYEISDISIIESDGTQLLADMAFKLLGYEDLANRLNVKLVNVSKSPNNIKILENNRFIKKIKYPEIVQKAKWFISVPKIKIHTLCSFGATMKNQFGCNPVPRKTIYHNNIHDCVVDITAAFKPNLIVVDGLIAMEGRGPVHGIPVKLDTLIFGRDVLAIDHFIAKLIGVNPDKVKYFTEAKKRGLGTTDYVVVGAGIDSVSKRLACAPKKSNLYGLLSI